MKEEIRAAGWLTAAWFWILLLVIAGSAVVYFVQPYFVAKETQTIRQSNAYITAHQKALTIFKADYDGLEVRKLLFKAADAAGNAELVSAMEAQQAGIVRQMREEAILIPDNVPPDIQAFLSGR